MKTNEAIMAFSQSEKIKAGLIWASQAIQLLPGLPEDQRRGAERIVYTLLSMISKEIDLARILTRHEAWIEVEPWVERALIMIDSGIGHEGGVHLTRALSKVTNIGQESMTILKERELL
jgi:hypothetical protein